MNCLLPPLPTVGTNSVALLRSKMQPGYFPCSEINTGSLSSGLLEGDTNENQFKELFWDDFKDTQSITKSDERGKVSRL